MIYKSNIKSFKINIKKKLVQALDKLVNLNPPILFVVDNKDHLIGTLTDGDIRSHILKNNDLNLTLNGIVNKKPFICNYKDKIDKNFIKKKLYQNYLKGIPVIRSQKIIGAYFALMEDINPTPILIMAGGKGKRMLPLTKLVPKPLLRLHGKPILQHIIEDIKLENFNNVFVSLNYQRNKIKNFFKKNKNFNLNIAYFEEQKPLGTAGSLFFLKKLNLDFENFIVVNADVICDLKLEKILSYHNENKCLITIGCANYTHKIPFGVIKNVKGKFYKIDEKPVYNQLISSGIYVMNKKVLYKMQRSNFIDMNDFILKFNKDKIGIFPFYSHEDWMDLGNKKSFYKANNY